MVIYLLFCSETINPFSNKLPLCCVVFTKFSIVKLMILKYILDIFFSVTSDPLEGATATQRHSEKDQPPDPEMQHLFDFLVDLLD